MNMRYALTVTLLVGAGISASIFFAATKAPTSCPFATRPSGPLPLDGLEAERARWNQEARFSNPTKALETFLRLDQELHAAFGDPTAETGDPTVAWLASPARQLEHRYDTGGQTALITLTNLGGTFLVHRQVRKSTQVHAANRMVRE